MRERPEPPAAVVAAAYDGVPVSALARRLGVPRVAAYDIVGSTMDIAHRLAEEGAPPGTLVLSDEQTAGRGRHARPWASARHAGIWLTLLERPADADAMSVMALRLGLAAATVLDRHTHSPVGVKWPNDLFVEGRKIAGILVEARWQDGMPAWVAIGFGVNLRAPDGVSTAGSIGAVSRTAVLDDVVPALRAAAAAPGGLSATEMAAYARRDVARGRRCVAPVAGVVEGISATGELLVREGSAIRPAHTGSLVLVDDATAERVGSPGIR